jgi:TPR repeat protein
MQNGCLARWTLIAFLFCCAGSALAQTNDGPPILHSRKHVNKPANKAGKPADSNRGALSVEKQAIALYDQKRYAEASSLLDQACTGGSMEACKDLGNLFRDGNGVAKDASRAVDLFAKACDGEYIVGCNNLGSMYASGQGVTQNELKAATLFQKACDAGDEHGCCNLGYRYWVGSGVAQDRAKGKALLQKGCNMGDQWGCNRLKELQ